MGWEGLTLQIKANQGEAFLRRGWITSCCYVLSNSSLLV